jgi:8-oxo-dGTP pyrophosphatase MutT (NUDIX family)
VKFSIELIEKLTDLLQKPLPGQDAQYRMAPGYRPKLAKDEVLAQNPKVGAVMILLYERYGEWHTVFTQRHSYDGVHSGQMSFPGGKRDEGDPDLNYTALRETQEEVGVEPTTIKVIGSLSDLYIPPSNFLVYPVVGYAENRPDFKPQEAEVKEIVELPLSFFLNSENIKRDTRIKLYNGNYVTVPAYVFNDYVIWGATAIILSEFTYLLEQIEITT